MDTSFPSSEFVLHGLCFQLATAVRTGDFNSAVDRQFDWRPGFHSGVVRAKSYADATSGIRGHNIVVCGGCFYFINQ